MKNLPIILILSLVSITVLGQDFYYSNNRKYYLEKAEHWATIQVKEKDINNFKSKNIEKLSLYLRQELYADRGFFWLEMNDHSSIDETIDLLKEEIEIVRVFPAYYSIDSDNDTIHIIMSDYFHVRFKENVPIEDINELNEQYFVEIANNTFLDNVYRLRLTEESFLNTLEVANIYYENDMTVYSVPDFFVNIKDESIIEDPFFDPYQWHLLNYGQSGGVSGIDINAIPAWNITIGSQDIIVAVAETRTTGFHEDFNEEQFVTGIDGAQNDITFSDLEVYAGSHATCVTGIIIANHNDIGVRGVSPNVKTMPISLFYISASWNQRAEAIKIAVERGADVINNSWGVQNLYDDYFADALIHVMENGRNGKGTVVVKSAGNTNCGVVTFPGDVPGVITVGAVTNLSLRASYSACSDFVDIVAPSNGGTLGITTTDLYNNYRFNFGGTSAAAPQVSGIAALMLSVNPDLTRQQVADIIERTARKVGDYNYQTTEGRPNGTWNNQMGYGLVDAYAALLEACIQEFYISWNIEENETVHFKASETIIANNVIEFGANATYQAGNRIVLQHGFHAKQGSNFHAYIAPCEIGGGGTKMLITDNNTPPHIGRTDNNIKEREDEIPADIEQPDYKYIFSVYPNPFDNSTTIKFSHNHSSKVKIYLTNTYGQEVLHIHNQYTAPGNYEINIEGNTLQPGVYFCVMETETGREVIKLMKM